VPTRRRGTRAARPSKLDPFKDELHRLLADDRVGASRSEVVGAQGLSVRISGSPQYVLVSAQLADQVC